MTFFARLRHQGADRSLPPDPNWALTDIACPGSAAVSEVRNPAAEIATSAVATATGRDDNQLRVRRAITASLITER